MDYNKLSITQVIEGYKNLEFSPIDVMEACLKAIKGSDSKLNAFVTVLDEKKLISEAMDADEVLASASDREALFIESPLHGVPYACKDNFNTHGILTTASSNVLKNYIAPYESTVTKKLKDAGAILIGKTNMDAFAHGSSTETSDFFTTKNPYDETRVAGGSSGGSAAAVAANMCIFAIGSETAGSIRGPAAWCGEVGLKPTYGRISRYGFIAMASSTDCPGPITKTVEDAAYLLNVLAGKDSLDATTSTAPVEDYIKSLGTTSLKNIKIGVPKSYLTIELEKGVKEKTLEAIQKLKDLGAEILEIDLLDPKYSIAVYTVVQRSEVSSNLARLDGIRYGNDRSHFGKEAKKRIMLGTYTLSAGYYDAYYSKAQKVRTLIIENFNEAFDNVDVIFGPTMPCVATKIGSSNESAIFGELMDVLAEPSSLAGLPAISVNAGFVDGLPVGVQFIGKQFDETTILKVANVFHKDYKGDK